MRNLVFTVLIAQALSACTTTTYRSHETKVPETMLASRDVFFDVADGLYRDPPDCVTILPSPAGTPLELAKIVERAAARHLREKVQRVIGPKARRRAGQKLTLDLTNKQDRKRFARIRTCRYFLEIHEVKAGDVYALVWSERSLTLALSLQRARDGAVAWRATHTASRSDGGLPLSPISLGGAAIRAGMLHGDQEALPSLLDDAMRRMFVTLPDMRW
jgi:hypothetical protein